MSERRVCGATGFARSSQRYRSTADPQDELRLRLKELAAARVRYGYRRLHVLLRREGWPINAKRVYRLYHEEGLSIRPQDAAPPAFDPLAVLRSSVPMTAGRWTLWRTACATGAHFGS